LLNSTTVNVAGGDTYTKVVYFPMALEPAPLTWLESLTPNSIHSWEDLMKVFIDNFQGSLHRVATCWWSITMVSAANAPPDFMRYRP
jgi:hypothetical protein